MSDSYTSKFEMITVKNGSRDCAMDIALLSMGVDWDEEVEINTRSFIWNQILASRSILPSPDRMVLGHINGAVCFWILYSDSGRVSTSPRAVLWSIWLNEYLDTLDMSDRGIVFVHSESTMDVHVPNIIRHFCDNKHITIEEWEFFSSDPVEVLPAD